MAIVGIVVFSCLYLNRKDTGNNTDESSPTSGESKIVLERIYESPQVLSSQTITAGSGTLIASIPTHQASPTVKTGILDYTNNPEPKDKNLEEYWQRTERDQKKADICESIGLSDKWSEPVEKTFCGVTKFTIEHILNPLGRIACDAMVGAWMVNYDKDITVNYEGGECLIKDRN